MAMNDDDTDDNDDDYKFPPDKTQEIVVSPAVSV